ncbi:MULTISPECIES: LuxR C-terminal-related transcriptional regulator [unclassified Nocardia]|uniref:LuxR C-terminal-related transcriptional regulator n=1 Tax=unclassified Nocardia TaxID=2637762 RepID=UPI001CE4197F|nr:MULTISPECIES: LuxR C-terminal-related transcriptional regulator [unclassified Nocardia]
MVDAAAELGHDDVIGVYQALVRNPEWGAAELRDHLGITEGRVSAALAALTDMTLLRRSVHDPRRWHVIDPKTACESVFRRRQEELLRQQQLMLTVEKMIARQSAHPESNGVSNQHETLVGIDSLHAFLGQYANEVQTSWYAATRNAVPSEVMAAPILEQHLSALFRGVELRKIVPESARHDPVTRHYADLLARVGNEIRTVPALSLELIVLDSTVALIPLNNDDIFNGVVVLREPRTVAALAACFQQAWDISEPFNRIAAADDTHLSAQERQLLRFLAEGMTDEAIARRLAISARTSRRVTTGLMRRLGARSRFEAGVKAARLGWV